MLKKNEAKAFHTKDIKVFFESVKDKKLKDFNNYKEIYGILGVIAVLAVVIKVFLFYRLMGIMSNIIPILLITLIFTYLLFRLFNNKWIPAVIFAAVSILMFCDVTYSSFFNRYLSVGMIGAAEVVGDIGESIKEVLRPVNFLMIADAILILCTLKFKKKPQIEGESRRIRRRSKRGINYISLFLIIIIQAILILNISGSSLFKSISNQEFYTFHVKDLVGGIFGYGTAENMAAWTDEYVWEKNGPLFGAAEGKNLVVIQLESVQNFVVGMEYNGQQVTPNMNALIQGNSTYFDNFYQQIGSGNTSDAEFAVNNSLYGTLSSYTYKLFNENYFRGLPVLLAEKGYDTAVFHAHENRAFWSRETMYPAQGWNRYYGGLMGRGGDYDMKEWMGWGLTDSHFYPQTVELMKNLKEPFYSFVISISNHHPYEMLDHYRFIELLPEDENTIVGNYIQSAAYTDYALGIFFEELKKAELYENTLFVIYGDHTGLPHSSEIDEGMEKVLGKPYDFEEMLSVPLIIYMPDDTTDIHQVISKAGGQTDVLPTVAYIMGFDELDTVYTGHNLYTVKSGFVAEQTFMTKGSFFTDEVAYEMSRDGVFENGRAWNINTGEAVDLSECYEGYLRSMDVVNTSEYVLRSDAIRKIFLEGGSVKDVGEIDISRIYPDEIVYAGYPDAQLIGTNSREALDYSVYAGYKDVRLDIHWNENSEPYTIDEKTGETAMEHKDIIEWIQNHGNVNVYCNMEKSGDYMMKFCRDSSAVTEERIVLELPNTEEYTGKYQAMLDISSSGLSLDTITEFIETNKVWAVVMTKEDAEGEFAPLCTGGVKAYINDEEAGIITKAN